MEKRGSACPPSVNYLGSLVLERLFQKSCSTIEPSVMAERVLALIESEGSPDLATFYYIAFLHLQVRAINEAQRNTILCCIAKVTQILGRSAKHRSQVVQFFNDIDNFPVNLLESFDPSVSLRLAVCGSFSRHAAPAKQLLSKLLEKIDDSAFSSLPIDIIFDLNELKLGRGPVSGFAHLGTDYDLDVSTEVSPSLYDIVTESDSRSLTSPAHINRLFDFFPEFNEHHAAEFVTALSSQNCSFRTYFAKLEETQKDRIVTLFRDSLTERNVDLGKIETGLDIPKALPLDNEGCQMLFTLLQGLLKEQRISFRAFATKWQNELAQVKFLWYLANCAVPSMNMALDCRMCDMGEYQAPSGIPNNCWLCLDYVECTLRLAEHFEREFVSVYKGAVDKYNVVILIVFSQIERPESEVFKKICVNMMSSLIQSRQAAAVLDQLWASNPSFMRWLYTVFYYHMPNKSGVILDSIGSHLGELLDSDDINFVIDIAFQASLRDMLSIGQWMRQVYEKYSESVLGTILDFVKSIVLDSTIGSPALLSATMNAMFNFLWDIFDSLSPDMKLRVNIIYSICDSSIPNIKRVPFVESLPSINTPDVKEAAAEYFQKFSAGEIPVVEFVQLFHRVRVSEQSLFRAMEHCLITELKDLEHHDRSAIERLAQLVGHMVHENLLGEDQLKNVFDIFINAYHSNVNSPLYLFACLALEVCWAKLVVVPQYVFKLLQEPLFKSSQPQLYEKLRKLSSNLATPVRQPRTPKLTLHPKLRKFEKIPIPPPRVCRLIQQIRSDPSLIQQILAVHSEHFNWLALHLVATIQDHPTELTPLLQHLHGTTTFKRVVLEAAIFESIQLIKSDSIATYEGGFARRRLSILGRLIGELTLAVNRTIPGRFLDLKQLLMFAFMQGRLFGVIPFVSAILCKASPYFDPPNPYTSGILQIIASIGKTDLLKFHIKNQIGVILNHFHVIPAQLDLVSLVPDMKQNNFDFVASPFSLGFVLSPADMDRILQFDDSVFNALAAQNIVVPDPPKSSRTTREAMKSAITTAALNFVKAETPSLSKFAAATAGGVIEKDFVYSTKPTVMFETAATLTKQLAAGLTLSTVCQKFQRVMTRQMRAELGTADDAEWIAMTVQVNYNWITQILQDVVHMKAWKQVQQRLETLEEQKRSQGPRYLESINRSRPNLRVLPASLHPVESGLTPHHQIVYQDMAQITLSPAAIVIPDMTAERGIRPNPAFESYCNQITKSITPESPQTVDANEIAGLLKECPVMNPTYEEFLSVIRIMMKYMAKVNHPRNDRIYGALLQHVVAKFPQAFVPRARENVIQWLRNSIPSVALLCVFLDVKLVTTTQLDRFFFDNLNRQPFNCRLFVLSIRFLVQTLVETKTIPPSDMISSLSLVVSTSLDILEQPNQPQQEFFAALRTVFEEMDVPLNILSPDSKLETLPTFDANEGIANADAILAMFNKFKEAAHVSGNDDAVIAITKDACTHGKDFFVVAFFNGQVSDVKLLMEYVKKSGCLKSSWADIAAAITLCVTKNAMVLKMNMRNYFEAMEAILAAISDDPDLLLRYASLLHVLRPLAAPSFSFPWIELATESKFVSGLVGNPEGWDAMVTVVCDFICAVTSTCELNPPSVFDRLYQALLRFILILCHDYPDFVASSAPEFVVLLPPNFTQLHNIVLSATPSTVKVTPIDIAMKSIIAVPGIDTFVPSQQPLKNLIEELRFADASHNESVFSELVTQLVNRCATGVIASFVIYLTNQNLHGLSLKQTSAESTHVYFVLSKLIEKMGENAEAVSVLVNVMVDQLTYQSRTTLFFFKALLSLFKSDHVVSPGLHLNELVLRTVLERVMTPPPRPWGLELFVRELFENPEIGLWKYPFVTSSEAAMQMLRQVARRLGIRAT